VQSTIPLADFNVFKLHFKQNLIFGGFFKRWLNDLLAIMKKEKIILNKTY
jgi:hypothetical protein